MAARLKQKASSNNKMIVQIQKLNIMKLSQNASSKGKHKKNVKTKIQEAGISKSKEVKKVQTKEELGTRGTGLTQGYRTGKGDKT